jgi:hypothetical protein
MFVGFRTVVFVLEHYGRSEGSSQRRRVFNRAIRTKPPRHHAAVKRSVAWASARERFWLRSDFPNLSFSFSSMFFPRGVECLTVSESSEIGDTTIKGTMMQFPLTLAPLLERAGKLSLVCGECSLKRWPRRRSPGAQMSKTLR